MQVRATPVGEALLIVRPSGQPTGFVRKAEGNKKFSAVKHSEADADATETLLKEVAFVPYHVAWAEYLEYCRLNHLDVWSVDSEVSFVAVMELSPLTRTSVKSYSEVIENYKHIFSDLDGYKRSRLRAHVAREVKLNPGGHAPDATLSALEGLFVFVLPVWQPIFWLSLACGLRHCGLRELWYQNLHYDSAVGLKITVLWDKNIRSVSDSGNVRLPTAWLPRLLPPPSLLQLIAIGGPVPVSRFTTADFLRELKRAASQAGWLKKPTTYTCRRNYVHRIVYSCTDENGVTDWEAVKQKTLHFKEQTIKSYYDLSAADQRMVGANYNPWE